MATNLSDTHDLRFEKKPTTEILSDVSAFCKPGTNTFPFAFLFSRFTLSHVLQEKCSLYWEGQGQVVLPFFVVLLT